MKVLACLNHSLPEELDMFQLLMLIMLIEDFPTVSYSSNWASPCSCWVAVDPTRAPPGVAERARRTRRRSAGDTPPWPWCFGASLSLLSETLMANHWKKLGNRFGSTSPVTKKPVLVQTCKKVTFFQSEEMVKVGDSTCLIQIGSLANAVRRCLHLRGKDFIIALSQPLKGAGNVNIRLYPVPEAEGDFFVTLSIRELMSILAIQVRFTCRFNWPFKQTLEKPLKTIATSVPLQIS